jgi:aminoglycoside phosphotransferase (APT) family kinase protein
MTNATDPNLTGRKLEEWLRIRWPEFSDLKVDSVSLPKEPGNSAETSLVSVSYNRDGGRERRELVVRRQLEGYDIFLDPSLELPFRMMQSMGEFTTVPVPAVIGIEFDRSFLGTPFLVMERVPGKIIAQNPNYNRQGWLADLPPERQREVWFNAIDAMAAINRVDWRDGFKFLDRPERGLPGLPQYLNSLEMWHRWAAAGRANRILDAGMTYLRERQPANVPVSVLWGDSHASNILFADDLSVAAVIDWEAAALGTAEVDFGYWLFFDEVWSTGQGVPRLAGLPNKDEMASRYERALGRPLGDVSYYEILGAVRFAIVMVRFADRMSALGLIPKESKAVSENPATLILAQKLGIAPPKDLSDFIAMTVAAGRG